MERSLRNEVIVKIISLAILIGYAVYFVGVPVTKSAVRRYQLRQMPYYVVYDVFSRHYEYSIHHDDIYKIYVMVNEEQSDLSGNDAIKNLVTDSFIAEMRKVPETNPDGNLYDQYGEHDIWVHLLLPTEELPYGWQKSYLDISCNIQFSVISNAERAKLIIPTGASNLNECELVFE